MILLALLVVADTAVTVPVAVAPAETLSVSIEGTGQPVVFLPGLFGAAFGFRHVTPPLVADGYRTLIVEPLGIGKSARPRDADYSLAAQAHRVAAALDSLAVTGAILVSHSVGSGIAFRVALLRPDLVTGIVSIEGGPTERATTPGFRFLMRFSGVIRRFGGARLLRRQVYATMRESSADTRWITEEVVDGYTADAARDLGATLRAYRGIAQSEEPWPLAPRLAQLRCPVLLLMGGADHPHRVPRDEIRLLQDSLPAFAIQTVPDVGHFIFEEGPDAVVTAVRIMRRDTMTADADRQEP